MHASMSVLPIVWLFKCLGMSSSSRTGIPVDGGHSRGITGGGCKWPGARWASSCHIHTHGRRSTRAIGSADKGARMYTCWGMLDPRLHVRMIRANITTNSHTCKAPSWAASLLIEWFYAPCLK